VGRDSTPAFYRLVWKPATIAAGLEGFRVGQLRHTGAMIALDAGASPLLVAFRLGHTSTRMVEKHYAGRLDGFDKEIAKELDTRHGAARMRHRQRSQRLLKSRIRRSAVVVPTGFEPVSPP
jgi:integrase